jgi:hypothetical protein
MRIRPRHIAALLYLVLTTLLVLGWVFLLTPWHRAADQLSVLFAQGHENRAFFVWFAVATIAAPILAALFLSRQATLSPMPLVLAIVSALYFALSLWQFDWDIRFNAGAAFVSALFAWHRA